MNTERNEALETEADPISCGNPECGSSVPVAPHWLGLIKDGAKVPVFCQLCKRTTVYKDGNALTVAAPRSTMDYWETFY